MTRRGWTLLELLLVLVVSTVLAALVATVIAGAARSATRQARALDRERTQAALAAWWHAALRDAEPGDVAVIAADRILVPLPVGAAVPCGQVAAGLLIARSAWSGSRDPEAGRDVVWLLTDPQLPAWDRLAILAVANDACPGGEPALRLSLAATSSTARLARVMEPIQLRLYRAGAAGWLGLAPADATAPVQPFAGPIELATSWFAAESGGVRAVVRPLAGLPLELFAPLPTP